MNLTKKYPDSISFARRLIIAIALVGLVALMELPALAQVQGTSSGYCLSNAPLTFNSASSNLTTSQYNWVPVRRDRDLGLGPEFIGANSTNTGVIGFQMAFRYRTNSVTTTTKPVTVTSTANSTSVVRDWLVVPKATIGPADSFAIIGVTNGGTINTISTIICTNVVYQWQN